MSVRLEARLWMLQRASAAALAFCVLVHLATMIYEVRGGLGAADILARTRGNLAWAIFYGFFVTMVSVHAAVGLRTILGEWAGLRGRAGLVVALVVALSLFAFGLRAVGAVVRP